MSPDLFHPATATDVVEIARPRRAPAGHRLLIVGGRRHIDKGNPSEVDAELWTTQLDQVVAYDPAEMLAVVQAGMRCGALAEMLAEHGQEWPADAPPDATVGGVMASGSSSARRLKVGALRDTVVEMELVTGDGRIVKSGARTVKNVTGYDVHRLMTGSLGTLGVITHVALKVRPLPERAVSLTAPGDPALAAAIAARVPLAAAVIATHGAVEVHLEGWSGEVDELTAAVTDLAADADCARGNRIPSCAVVDVARRGNDRRSRRRTRTPRARGRRRGRLRGPRGGGSRMDRREERVRAVRGARAGRGGRRHRTGDPRPGRPRRHASAGSRRASSPQGVVRPGRHPGARTRLGHAVSAGPRARRAAGRSPIG